MQGDVPGGKLRRIAPRQPGLPNVFEALKGQFGDRRRGARLVKTSQYSQFQAGAAQPLFESRGVLAQMTDFDMERGKIFFLKLRVIRMEQRWLKSAFHNGA